MTIADDMYPNDVYDVDRYELELKLVSFIEMYFLSICIRKLIVSFSQFIEHYT